MIRDLIDADDIRVAWNGLSISQQRAILESLQIKVIVKPARVAPGSSRRVYRLSGRGRLTNDPDPAVRYRAGRVLCPGDFDRLEQLPCRVVRLRVASKTTAAGALTHCYSKLSLR
jgi:hypothetical protein